MASGVYEIRCVVTGKRYIGRSINLDKRWREHLHGLRNGVHRCSKLQRAWNKYGEQTFEFKPLVFCGPDYAEEVEQRLLDAGLCEFNTSKSAAMPDNRGKIRTAEQRQAHSKAMRASQRFYESMQSPEHREAQAERMKKVWAARKAAGIKIDNSREYAPLSDEHKARVAAGLKAAWDSGKRSRVVSEEAKRKMRDAKLGQKLTDEHKRKIGEASKRQKGKTLNPEHLANLREAHAETARIRLIHKALHNGMV